MQHCIHSHQEKHQGRRNKKCSARWFGHSSHARKEKPMLSRRITKRSNNVPSIVDPKGLSKGGIKDIDRREDTPIIKKATGLTEKSIRELSNDNTLIIDTERLRISNQ